MHEETLTDWTDLVSLGDHCREVERDIEAALSYYKRAREAAPTRWETYPRLAAACQDLGRGDEARHWRATYARSLVEWKSEQRKKTGQSRVIGAELDRIVERLRVPTEPKTRSS